MIITDNDITIAQERAEKLLGGLSEDDRWSALNTALMESLAKERESMLALLTLETMRDLLYPGIDRDRWRKLGWSDALGGRTTPQQFIHKLRLAKAAGSSNGRL